MKKAIYFLLAEAFLLASLPMNAQNKKATESYSKKASSIVNKYKEEFGLAAQKATRSPEEGATLSPYLYKLIGPGVYYGSALSNKFQIDYHLPELQEETASTTDGMDYRQQLNASINDLLANTYIANPNMFHYYDSQIDSEDIIAQASVAGVKKEDLATIYDKVDEIQDVAEVVEEVDVQIHIEKPNFWTTKGRFALQFTQNYFSENWYKGGNNNVTLLSNLVLEANYNDQKRVQWDNRLDLRLGFITATADTCHRYLTNNDKIYLASKLDIKAAKNWFYSVSLEGNTQFLPGYKSNDRRAYSKFLAPLDVYVSLGMDWKPKLKNGNSFSLALLPLSYKMRYINAADETIHSSYNMWNKDFKQDFGSKIEFQAQMKIVQGLTWRSRCYCFTSYEYVEAELENVFSFQFNKYISSEINTLWRFDDNRSKDYYNHTLGYFQFKEFFTLGLSYNF